MATSNSAKLEKEALAQKLRQQALLHLLKEGQAVEKIPVSGVIAPKKDVGKGGDNTLDLLIKQKATAQINSASKVNPKFVKNDTPSQESVQVGIASASFAPSLPPNWREVPDASTGRSYYWNTVTNVTTWEKPAMIACSTSSSLMTSTSTHLPDGWVEKVHPATRQKYYVHLSTGRTSVAVPVKATSQKVDTYGEVGKRQRDTIDASEPCSKR